MNVLTSYQRELKLLYNKYSLDKVWTKIYCHFYFRGIRAEFPPQAVCTDLTDVDIEVTLI